MEYVRRQIMELRIVIVFVIEISNDEAQNLDEVNFFLNSDIDKQLGSQQPQQSSCWLDCD